MDVKQPSTYEEQLQKLKERGCIIHNENMAIEILHYVNYYRLTAYFLPFKISQDKYAAGTSFEKVYKIYEFDRKMRSILAPIIEELELMLRTQLAYYHAHKYGPLGYLDPKNYNGYHDHDKFMQHIKKDIKNNRNQPAVKHHLKKYNGKFPIWVIIEYSTMGELSYFYDDLLRSDKKALAKSLLQSIDTNVSSWLMCLTYLRNFCAHYSRLYFFDFPAIPATPKNNPYKLWRKLFDYIYVLKLLCLGRFHWNSSFMNNLKVLIDEYQEYIDLRCIGFPENWYDLLLHS
jgi:abortive infection bacteriophage resistance protein